MTRLISARRARRAGIAGPVILAVLASAAGCALREPSDFGKVCSIDGECDSPLACIDSRCAPPPPPVDPADVEGLTCDAPLALPRVDDLGLARWQGVVRLEPLAADALAAHGGACAGEGAAAGRFLSLETDAPISARVRVDGPAGARVALADSACDERESACSAASPAHTFDVPLLDGEVRLLVRGDAAVDVVVTVEQVRCPPRFIADGAGACLGFVPISGGPGPREGHTVSALTDHVLVAGGTLPGETEPTRELWVYDVRRTRWRERAMLAARSGHAAALLQDTVVLAGGAASANDDLDERHGSVNATTLRGFSNDQVQFGRPPATSKGLTLTAAEGRHPLLMVGPEVPRFTGYDFFSGVETCTRSSQCAAGFRCAIESDTELEEGFCVCASASCDPFTLQRPTWFDTSGALAAVTDRTGHAAVAVSDGTGAASLVFVAGGVTAEGPAPAAVYSSSGTFWVDRGDVVARRTTVEATATAGGLVVLAGGRDAAGAPADLVEVYDPLANELTRTARLARPRADTALALLDDARAIVIGGDAGDAALATTEIVDLLTGVVRAGPTLPHALAGHRAARLGSGEVFVAGGRAADAGEEASLMLSRIAETLIAPRIDTAEESDVPGASCEQAIPLEAVADGVFFGNTLEHDNDFDALAISTQCTGFDSAGRDVVFTLTLPEGARLDVSLDSTDIFFDVVLLLLASCDADSCLAAADNEVLDRPEAFSYVNNSGAEQQVFLVVDAFDPGVFPYRLEWSVTP